MARTKLQIPDRLLETIRIPVRISDINYGNHLGNDAFVSIIHEARMQWLRKYSYTELEIEGIGMIMSDLVIEFKNESFYGDLIEVKLFSGEPTRVAFELYYQLSALRNTDTVLLANAKTGMVCFDYKIKKVATIPEKLMSILIG